MQQPLENRPSQSRLTRIVLALTVLAFLVRLWGVAAHSYWFDEAREVLRLLTPWPDVLFVTEGVDPPLYRLLLFPLASFTAHEFWLRLPSVVFSAATVYLVYIWLKARGEALLGAIAAGLLAVSAVQIYYAQEVSQYSLVVFLAVVVLIAFDRAGEYGRWLDWVFLSLAGLGAAYTYYGLAWLFPVLDVHLAWRVWRQRSRRRIVGFVLFHLAIGIGLAALYFLMLSNHIDRFTTRKNLTPLFIEPGILATLRNLDDQLLNGIARFFAIPFSADAPVWIGIAMLVLALLGTVTLWLRSAAGRQIAVYLWAIIGVMFIARVAGLYPFGGRYAFAALPLFFTAVAAVILWLRRWLPAALTLGGAVLLLQVAFWPNLGMLLGNPWLDLPREELRPVLAYYNEHAQVDDAVYVYYGAVPAYRVYQQNADREVTLGTWFRSRPNEEKVAEIHTAVAGADRFWLVASHIHGDEVTELITALAAAVPAYTVADQYWDTNAAVVLLQRVP